MEDRRHLYHDVTKLNEVLDVTASQQLLNDAVSAIEDMKATKVKDENNYFEFFRNSFKHQIEPYQPLPLRVLRRAVSRSPNSSCGKFKDIKALASETQYYMRGVQLKQNVVPRATYANTHFYDINDTTPITGQRQVVYESVIGSNTFGAIDGYVVKDKRYEPADHAAFSYLEASIHSGHQWLQQDGIKCYIPYTYTDRYEYLPWAGFRYVKLLGNPAKRKHINKAGFSWLQIGNVAGRKQAYATLAVRSCMQHSDMLYALAHEIAHHVETEIIQQGNTTNEDKEHVADLTALSVSNELGLGKTAAEHTFFKMWQSRPVPWEEPSIISRWQKTHAHIVSGIKQSSQQKKNVARVHAEVPYQTLTSPDVFSRHNKIREIMIEALFRAGAYRPF